MKKKEKERGWESETKAWKRNRTLGKRKKLTEVEREIEKERNKGWKKWEKERKNQCWTSERKKQTSERKRN